MDESSLWDTLLAEPVDITNPAEVLKTFYKLRGQIIDGLKTMSDFSDLANIRFTAIENKLTDLEERISEMETDLQALNRRSKFGVVK